LEKRGIITRGKPYAVDVRLSAFHGHRWAMATTGKTENRLRGLGRIRVSSAFLAGRDGQEGRKSVRAGSLP
jgi:hypothetical protein